MIAEILIKNKKYKTDLSKPMDISIPLRAGNENVIAWYAPPATIEPVRMGDWVGEVAKGGSVNFNNVFFNPHAHGTHTECAGHISKEFISLNQNLKSFFFLSHLISVTPEKIDGDEVITLPQILSALNKQQIEALIIRTLPNELSKNIRHYSNTNPAYLHYEAAQWMCTNGVKHLLLDVPSVDKEKDDGKLLAHRAFWNYPASTRMDATITELIFVPDEIKDGIYLLNIQITSLENDASPSKPVLYAFL